MHFRKRWFIVLAAVIGRVTVPPTMAHSPIVFNHLLSIHHATTSATTKYLANIPVSGSARAFQASMKNIVGGTLKNTVLHAPLNNVSGQFTGYDYQASTAGFSGPYYVDSPNVQVFGSNALNTGMYGSSVNVPLVNVISTGLHPVGLINLFPFTGQPVSGAQRALQNYYNAGATAGYNGGISLLQHPSGGLFFSSVTFGAGPVTYSRSPAFYAFGNNPYASTAVAQSIAQNPISFAQPLASYIQFGKIIRPITNGNLYSTYYGAVTANPPYGAGVPNPYSPEGYVMWSFGSANPMNTFYTSSTVTPNFMTHTYFQ